ncbi:hypothetical protein [Nesterenkonia sp. NBAIMH1]|uniref:hypothetical protein n=1 Tax=Nesterenkonia sp. NBAIMH1 TaxID=2600320 RepID=UPI0011B70D11|nr:hypothetical protein [Nesterenkonia sp. NBAIMH1]
MRTPPEPNRSGTFDTTPHHRSASTRRRARRAREALERRFGGELSLRDRGDDPQAVEDFLALQAAGWKGDASKKGEAYQVTGRAEWLREVTDKFRSRGSSWHWTSAPETGPSTSCSASAQEAACAPFRMPTTRPARPTGWAAPRAPGA